MCALTGRHTEFNSSRRENSHGRHVLGMADVVVSAVSLQEIGKVQVPIEADRHSVALRNVNHFWEEQQGQEN